MLYKDSGYWIDSYKLDTPFVAIISAGALPTYTFSCGVSKSISNDLQTKIKEITEKD